MGYDQPRSLGDKAQAAIYTAPIFRDFMKMALKDKPDVPFRVPPGIKLISVDLKTGMRSTGRARSSKRSSPEPRRPIHIAAEAAARRSNRRRTSTRRSAGGSTKIAGGRLRLSTH